MTEPRGKPCPKCGYPLTDLSTKFRRLCGGCGAEYEWNLDPGQIPLNGSNRSNRGRNKR